MPLLLIPNSGYAAAIKVVGEARTEALAKHGPLKPGADRWMRLLGEEWEEVQDELASLAIPERMRLIVERAHSRKRAISELAQLAQLCIGVIELLQAEEATHGR